MPYLIGIYPRGQNANPFSWFTMLFSNQLEESHGVNIGKDSNSNFSSVISVTNYFTCSIWEINLSPTMYKLRGCARELVILGNWTAFPFFVKEICCIMSSAKAFRAKWRACEYLIVFSFFTSNVSLFCWISS